MVDYQRAGDITDVHAGLLLYGNPGVGKTHAVCQAPRPFVILTEKNGLTTVRRANPDALVALVTDVVALREVMALAISGSLPDGRKTLVVDSLTEVQRLFKDEIMGMKPKDAAEKFTLADWGTMHDKMRRFARTLRDTPYDVAATALAEQAVSDDGVQYTKPLFEGKKTGAEMAQYFNGVGYMFKRTKKGDKDEDVVHHLAMFDGPSHYITKSCHPLVGVLPMDMARWYNLIASNGNQ